QRAELLFGVVEQRTRAVGVAGAQLDAGQTARRDCDSETVPRRDKHGSCLVETSACVGEPALICEELGFVVGNQRGAEDVPGAFVSVARGAVQRERVVPAALVVRADA